MKEKLKKEIEVMIALGILDFELKEFDGGIKKYIDTKTEFYVVPRFLSFLQADKKVQLKEAILLMLDYLNLEFRFESRVAAKVRLVKKEKEKKPVIYKAKKIKIKPEIK